MPDSPTARTGVAALRWSVCPGAGRVAHVGSAIVVAVPGTAEQAAFVDTLLDTVETVVSAPSDSATPLFRALSGLVIDTRADQVAAFGVIADDGQRIAVLLCGDVALDIQLDGGPPEHLSGRDATTYLDRRFTGSLDRVVLAGTAAAAPDPRSDLRAGVTPGGGVAAGPRAGAAGPPPEPGFAVPGAARRPQPAPPDSGRHAAPSAWTGEPYGGQPGAPGPVAPTSPFTPAPPPAPAPRPAPTPPFVPAPSGPRAPVTGGSPAGGFAAAVLAPTPGPAAPAGGVRAVTLSIAGAPAVPVTGRAVIGRQPQLSPDVLDGSAEAIEAPDPSVSRVHALLTVRETAVAITDLGSANGTRLLGPDSTAWEDAVAHEPRDLAPGTRLLFGACEARCDYTPPGSSALPESLVMLERAAGGTTGAAGGIADYAFVRSLGQGYHGELYLAVPPPRLGLDAEYVVVKVITGVTSDDAFGRAVRELRAYASVESPYLLSVYDAGNDAGRFFYSTPYLTRGSLADAARALPSTEIVRAVGQAAAATHSLHEAGILHLGIAPGTILLGDEHAYLADVGATQSEVRQQTMSGVSSLQQVEFFEPRILLGERGTRASDIWSLGATLYRALTGVSIYGDFPEEPLVAVRAVLTSRPTLPAPVEDRVATIVRRCVDDTAPDHFTTAAELSSAIEAVLTG